MTELQKRSYPTLLKRAPQNNNPIENKIPSQSQSQHQNQRQKEPTIVPSSSQNGNQFQSSLNLLQKSPTK